MKIVYCLKSTFNSGGMERIVISKANHFSTLGHNVWIVTTDQKKRASFFPLGKNVRTEDLNINYDDIADYSFIKKICSRNKKLKKHKKELQRLVETIRPDIIISTFGNEIDFIHNLQTNSKIIGEIHFSRNYRLLLHQSYLRFIANKWLTYKFKKNVKKLDAFVCLTREDSKNWRGVKNLYVIPNFINNKTPTPALLNSKTVIAAGRLEYQKGYDYLIEAWSIVSKHYPDWKLEIYGSGPLENNLKLQIKNQCLSNTVSIYPPTHEIYNKLSESSIYVLSSRYEGLPMVLLEAMSCGLPIVAFECQCGPRDLIENTNAGLLVPCKDVEGLADSICSLIEDSKKRKIMGETAYQEADKYLFPVIIQKWMSLFNQLTSDRNEK